MTPTATAASLAPASASGSWPPHCLPELCYYERPAIYMYRRMFVAVVFGGRQI